MARRLRLQFPGATYHIINRGNYRRDVFESAGACRAFEVTLYSACGRFGWQLHAFVVMRNHFHLAVTTPSPNLVDGMHWLLTTFSTRFNRFRGERGHLFQGRYRALLIEDGTALGRVVDYIHLNPVRAGQVPVEQAETHPHSSLGVFTRGNRPAFLVAARWLAAKGLTETPNGWRCYLNHLCDAVNRADGAGATALTALPAANLSRGWAIGSDGWRQAVALKHAPCRLSGGYQAEDVRGIREARWTSLLSAALARIGRSADEISEATKRAAWKLALALVLREEGGAPHAWIAHRLHMGSPAGLRVALCQHRQRATPANR